MDGNRGLWLFCGALLLYSGLSLAGVAPRSGDQSAGQPAAQRSIAITVDDLPGAIAGTDKGAGELKELQKINRAIPAILKSHHVPAVGFVNEYKLQVVGERDSRTALLQMWLDAGLSLGNHTYSHADFQTTPLTQFEDDMIRGEVVTRALMTASGQTEKYFRHPFLNTGPTAEAKAALEAFLKQRGYTIVPVTLDCLDWMFNDVLGKAIETKDKKLASKAKKESLEYMDTVFGYFEGVSRALFGREIPQVLLLHDSELNAEELDAVLTWIGQRGYRFVSLDEALADPAYGTPDLYVGPEGISWLNRWRMSFGQDPDFKHNPDPPKWVMQMSNDYRASKSK